ncbi:hypothetical protein D3C79_1023520 [compost metagenome]
MTTTVELQQQCQTDTGLGCRQADRQDIHHLPIRLAPVASRHDKRQRRGVDHHFQTDQHKQQVATHQ